MGALELDRKASPRTETNEVVGGCKMFSADSQHDVNQN